MQPIGTITNVPHFQRIGLYRDRHLFSYKQRKNTNYLSLFKRLEKAQTHYCEANSKSRYAYFII